MYLAYDGQIMEYTVEGVHPLLSPTINTYLKKWLFFVPKDFSETLLLTQMLVTEALMSAIKKL